MKIRKIKIGIKSVKEALADFVKTDEAIAKGEKVKKEKGTYFESIEGLRKGLTPKRLELLRIIKEKHPKSLQELARLSNREMRCIITDIKILEELDLIDMKRSKEGRKESVPIVEYDAIEVLVAV